MVSAASYPPLQKTQERGTHGFETGRIVKKERATRRPEDLPAPTRRGGNFRIFLTPPRLRVPRPSRSSRRAGTTDADSAALPHFTQLNRETKSLSNPRSPPHRQHRTRSCKKRKDGAPTVSNREELLRKEGPPALRGDMLATSMEEIYARWTLSKFPTWRSIRASR